MRSQVGSAGRSHRSGSRTDFDGIYQYREFAEQTRRLSQLWHLSGRRIIADDGEFFMTSGAVAPWAKRRLLMKCPFCAEEVKADAVVCKHCRHDLTVVRALVERIEDLTKKLQHASALPTVTREQSTGTAPVVQAPHSERAAAVADAIERHIPLLSPLATVLLALGALLLAHFIIVIHYDLSLLWLHIASLVLPFAFGFIYRQNTTEYLSSDLLAGALLAVAAILAMSAVVAEVDKVPVLPTDRQGWIEYIEYGASIALAFFAGAVCRQTAIAMSRPTAKTSRFVYFAAKYTTAKVSGVTPHDPHDPRMDKYLKRVGLAEKIITASIAGASALVSVWSGLGQFL